MRARVFICAHVERERGATLKKSERERQNAWLCVADITEQSGETYSTCGRDVITTIH